MRSSQMIVANEMNFGTQVYHDNILFRAKFQFSNSNHITAQNIFNMIFDFFIDTSSF